MGRHRSDKRDPDRYLALRAGNYHYKRKVPLHLSHIDLRAPVIRMSLKTNDLAFARRKRDQLAAADDALWATMTTSGSSDPAQRKYEAAVRRVEALDFTFHGAAYFEDPANIDDLVDRVRFAIVSGKEDQIAEPLLGAIDIPQTTVSKAFEMYCDEIVADELIGKSTVQKDQWKKVKKRAVTNFINLAGDKAMEEITVDDAKKLYRFWLARIAPKDTQPTASASSGNRDVGNMRVLFASYFKHQGDERRRNPFEGFSFHAKKKRSRPPIPTEWIRDCILKPGNLATLNDEARGILLILIETGARPSEICNLEPSAIRLSHKVPHLSIEPREDPEDPREIKTASSQRMVPLIGVALDAAKHHKNGFPRYRNRENDFSAAINKYMRENKLLPSPKHTAYSFRHAFEDRMKEAGLEDELRRILMGHAIDRPQYGSGGSLEWRHQELKKIALPYDPSIV